MPRGLHRYNPSPDVLEGMPAIGRYLGFCPETIYRYIRDDGLPAMKLRPGRWFVTKSAIDKWIVARHLAERKARGWPMPESADAG